MSLAAALALLAVLVQAGLTLALYFVLFRARAAAVRRGDATFDTFAVPRDEPREAARVSRSLSNQYELPVIFYALVLALVGLGATTLFDAAVAWIFALSRIAHAWVHTMGNDVLSRGRVFAVGFVCVVVLALRVLFGLAGGL